VLTENGAKRARTASADAGRAVFGVLAAAALAGWTYFALLLAAFTCDENCVSPGQAEWWGYTAQLVLAALGAGLGIVALTLGFTSKTKACRVFTALSLVCVVTWIVWVPASGNF
jgi:hypothetical protein